MWLFYRLFQRWKTMCCCLCFPSVVRVRVLLLSLNSFCVYFSACLSFPFFALPVMHHIRRKPIIPGTAHERGNIHKGEGSWVAPSFIPSCCICLSGSCPIPGALLSFSLTRTTLLICFTFFRFLVFYKNNLRTSAVSSANFVLVMLLL